VTDWLREQIERECVVEREGWAAERVARVSERLQRDVPAAERLETLVIWIDRYNAFTAPGRTIYMSRRLLERFADDDAAAFVVAHELAHHRLGHVPPPLPTGLLLLPLRIVLALLRLRVATPAHERDADLLAIEMCLEAGYDPARCIAAFELLDQVALDYGDIDGSLGADGGWADGRSHPPTRARIEALRAHVAAWRNGHRLAAELAARDQERRTRRRRALAATAGGAALTVGLIVLRRRFPGAG
jgi:Zn-dependent protease with chaperone function